jgi:hypothetical protein
VGGTSPRQRIRSIARSCACSLTSSRHRMIRSICMSCVIMDDGTVELDFQRLRRVHCAVDRRSFVVVYGPRDGRGGNCDVVRFVSHLSVRSIDRRATACTSTPSRRAAHIDVHATGPTSQRLGSHAGSEWSKDDTGRWHTLLPVDVVMSVVLRFGLERESGGVCDGAVLSRRRDVIKR